MRKANEVSADKTENGFVFPSRETTELLSSLVYSNYGRIANASSVNLSKANNLALATDKCLLLLNLNFDWPSSLNHSSAAKHFFQPKREDVRSSSSNKHEPHGLVFADSWIQDLHECKNEAFCVSVIRSVPKSRLFFDLNRQFFALDELGAKNKRKSYFRQVQKAKYNFA